MPDILQLSRKLYHHKWNQGAGTVNFDWNLIIINYHKHRFTALKFSYQCVSNNTCADTYKICDRLIDDIGQLLSPSGSNSLSAPSYRPAGPYTWALTKAPRGARKTAPWQGPLWRWRCESAPSIQGRSEKKANASFRWLETPPVSTATKAYNSPAVCVFCWLMMVYLVFYLIYSSTRSDGLRRLWPWPFSTSCEGDNWN